MCGDGKTVHHADHFRHHVLRQRRHRVCTQVVVAQRCACEVCEALGAESVLGAPRPRPYGVEVIVGSSGVFERPVLFDDHLKPARLQHRQRDVEPAVHVVQFKCDLLNHRPLLITQAEQHLELGLFDVDLEQVNAGQPALGDDVTQRAKAHRDRDRAQFGRQHLFDRRIITAGHVALLPDVRPYDFFFVGNVGMQAREDREAWIKSEVGGALGRGDAAVEDPCVRAKQAQVAFQQRTHVRIGFHTDQSKPGMRHVRKHREHADVGAYVHDHRTVVQVHAVAQVGITLEHLREQEVGFVRVELEDREAVLQRVALPAVNHTTHQRIDRHRSHKSLIVGDQRTRRPDTFVPGQRLLDFTKLDAVTTHLDLVIHAAEEFNAAIVPNPPAITGAIHAARGHGRHRTLDKRCGRRSRITEISPGHAWTTDDDLTRHAQRRRPEVRIKHHDVDIGQRPPKQRRVIVDAKHVNGGIDSTFRRSVEVHQRRRARATEAVPEGARQCLAACENGANSRGTLGQTGIHQPRQLRRRGIKHVHTHRGDVRQQRFAIQTHLLGDEHQRAALQELIDLFDGCIKRECAVDAHTIAQCQRLVDGELECFNQVAQRPVFNHHTLGHTGGTGCKEHIRSSINRHRRKCDVRGGFKRTVHNQDTPGGCFNRRPAISRPGGIDGDVGRPGVQRTQHRGNRLGSTVHEHTNTIARLHAATNQRLRRRDGHGFELGEGQLVRTRYNRDARG